MNIKIKIWNYRSIPMDSPLELNFSNNVMFILGVNNVGKSNLLKFFYELRSMIFYNPNNNVGQSNISANTSYEHLVNRRFRNENIRYEVYFDDYCMKYRIAPEVPGQISSNRIVINYELRDYPMSPQINATLLEGFSILSRTLYIGSSRIVHGNSSNYFDITVGSNFFANWSAWASGGNLTYMDRIAALVKELKELFGFHTFDIRINDNRTDLLVTTDDQIFNLNDLGVGIAHFILVLGNAMIRQPSIILIDEPETGLHPRLQQLFIQALAAKSEHGLLATSHSIALARSTADEILSLTKDETGKVRLAPFGSHFEMTLDQSITELSYSQYVELGASGILLVEGRTDVKAFREILRLFNVEHQYIIIPFGGRQFMTTNAEKIVEELQEISRFNARVCVVFDSEFTSATDTLKPEFQTFKDCCEKLGFKVFATEYHSTENYISEAAAKRITPGLSGVPGKFEKFSGQWSKERNWLMFREMKMSDFATTKLKTFIETTMKQ